DLQDVRQPQAPGRGDAGVAEERVALVDGVHTELAAEPLDFLSLCGDRGTYRRRGRMRPRQNWGDADELGWRGEATPALVLDSRGCHDDRRPRPLESVDELAYVHRRSLVSEHRDSRIGGQIEQSRHEARRSGCASGDRASATDGDNKPAADSS